MMCYHYYVACNDGDCHVGGCVFRHVSDIVFIEAWITIDDYALYLLVCDVVVVQVYCCSRIHYIFQYTLFAFKYMYAFDMSISAML